MGSVVTTRDLWFSQHKRVLLTFTKSIVLSKFAGFTIGAITRRHFEPDIIFVETITKKFSLLIIFLQTFVVFVRAVDE